VRIQLLTSPPAPSLRSIPVTGPSPLDGSHGHGYPALSGRAVGAADIDRQFPRRDCFHARRPHRRRHPRPAPTPTPGAELPIALYDKVMAAYFPEWGIYGRNFQVADVPAEKLTHLIYSFLTLKSNGEVALYDSFAAVEKRFGAGETVSGEADQWYYPPGDPRATQTVWGNFNQLAQLKEKYPHMRVSIAVGG